MIPNSFNDHFGLLRKMSLDLFFCQYSMELNFRFITILRYFSVNCGYGFLAFDRLCRRAKIERTAWLCVAKTWSNGELLILVVRNVK